MDVYDEHYESVEENIALDKDELDAIISEAMDHDAGENLSDSNKKWLLVGCPRWIISLPPLQQWR